MRPIGRISSPRTPGPHAGTSVPRPFLLRTGNGARTEEQRRSQREDRDTPRGKTTAGMEKCGYSKLVAAPALEASHFSKALWLSTTRMPEAMA